MYIQTDRHIYNVSKAHEYITSGVARHGREAEQRQFEASGRVSGQGKAD